MADSLIRWKRSDYVKLGKAVSSFNKKIRELEVDEAKYLPELKDYKELKNKILSRKELNRMINSLTRFSNVGMAEKVNLPSGQEITKWELREIKLSRNRAIKNLLKEKEEVESGLKWIGMGDERIDQIESTLESIQNIEFTKGSKFKKSLHRINYVGSVDYELIRAQQYRENFMYSLWQMSEYDNFEKLYLKLESIKNPISFFKFVQQSETLSDLFLYYRDRATASTYGGFASNQDAFNHVLEELKIK